MKINIFKKFRRRYKWDDELDKALKEIELKQGGHSDPERGFCMFEAFSWITGQGHNYQPVCVHPALVDIGIAINDSAEKDFRQKLKPLLKKLITTQPVYKSGPRRDLPLETPKAKQLAQEIHQKGIDLGILEYDDDFETYEYISLGDLEDDFQAYKKLTNYADKRAKALGFKE